MNPTHSNILVFLGRAPRQFLSLQLFHGILLITSVVAVLLGFYVTMFLIPSRWLFVVWLILVVMVLFIVKRSLLRKHLVKMGHGYLVFMEDRAQGEGGAAQPSPAAAGELLRSLALRWRDMGAGFLPLKVLVPLTAVHLAHPNRPPADERIVKESKSLWKRMRLLEAAVFVCILIPFLSLALLLAAPLGFGVTALVATVAFLFAYFLLSAIFQPFLLLRMQGEIAALFNKGISEK